MGYAFVLAPCFVCKQIFTFHPRKVPSYRDEPICQNCIQRVNAQRKEKGLEQWPILPGAYEPCEEEEL